MLLERRNGPRRLSDIEDDDEMVGSALLVKGTGLAETNGSLGLLLVSRHKNDPPPSTVITPPDGDKTRAKLALGRCLP